MTPERYAKLQDGPEPQTLTPEELKQGWHWCVEMDGLLCLVGGSDCFCVEDKQRFALVPVVFDKTTMNTNQLGAIGMAQAILEYQKRGYCVSIPLVDAQEYDLVIEKDEVFQSVQCKYTSRKSSSNPVSYEVGLRTSSLNRSIKNKGTFDLLFILCSDGTCYSIPHGELPQTATSLGPKYKEFQLRD